MDAIVPSPIGRSNRERPAIAVLRALMPTGKQPNGCFKAAFSQAANLAAVAPEVSLVSGRHCRSASSLDDHFKATVDHALSVERHGILVRLQARIGHDFLHALISHVARRPYDPREDDCFIVLAFDGHGKRRELPIGHIISPALDEFQRAVLLENHGSRFGMFFIDFAIGRGDSRNKSINISLVFLPRSMTDVQVGIQTCEGPAIGINAPIETADRDDN